jgi:hypothetical protein
MTSATPTLAVDHPSDTEKDVDNGGETTQRSSVFDLPVKVEGDATGADLEGASPEVTETETYPEGFALFMVITALVLSIFLVALDMVCSWPMSCHPTSYISTNTL